MMMHTWVGSPTDVRTGQEAIDAIRRTNDCRYYDPAVGVVRVDRRRWEQAQDFEVRGWTQSWNDQSQDRNDEHRQLFHDYQALGSDLGHVLEAGCGPFTQLQTIIRGRTASRVTLLDPLLYSYLTLAHCPYSSGSFQGLPTTLLGIMGEELTALTEFDTVVCINVLEHVLDAQLVLNNLYRALRPGGTLVLGERSFDGFDPTINYDVGHPIHVKKVVLNNFTSRFRPLFRNGDYFIGIKE